MRIARICLEQVGRSNQSLLRQRILAIVQAYFYFSHCCSILLKCDIPTQSPPEIDTSLSS